MSRTTTIKKLFGERPGRWFGENGALVYKFFMLVDEEIIPMAGDDLRRQRVVIEGEEFGISNLSIEIPHVPLEWRGIDSRIHTEYIPSSKERCVSVTLRPLNACQLFNSRINWCINSIMRKLESRQTKTRRGMRVLAGHQRVTSWAMPDE